MTQTNSSVIETTGSVATAAAPKLPTMQEKMIAAARATQVAVEAGTPSEEAITEGAKVGSELTAPAVEDDAEPAAAAAKAKAEPAENPIARIQREMRAREKARGMETEAAKLKAEATADREAARAEREAFAAKQAQLSEMFTQFQADPVKFAEANGINRDKLADQWAAAGKPEAVLAQRLEASERQLKQLTEFIQSGEQRRAQTEAEATRQRQVEAVQAAERSFVQKHATPEAAPNLHAVAKLTRQGEKYIVARAEEVADWFKAETGKYPSWETLAEFLEQQAATDLKEMGGVAQPKATKSAGKSTATTRTLSQEMSGERRSATKPLQDMTKAERLAAMEQAARDARRAAG